MMKDRLISIVVLLICTICPLSVCAFDDYSQFVNEVITEDDSDHFTGADETELLSLNNFEYEDQMRREREELEHERATANAIDTKNERIRKEREEAFAIELEKLKDDKVAAKKLLQQKKLDANIVNRIRKASKSNNYYGILGIRNFILSNVRIPKRTITIVPNHFYIQIPEIVLFGITEKHIKRAYRETAKAVHPDKSRDPRAVETFLMVEDAATILLNATTRLEYDAMLQKKWKQRRKLLNNQIQHGIQAVLRLIHGTILGGKKFLGPFTIPVVILVVLIV
jgi:DnaJ domain